MQLFFSAPRLIDLIGYDEYLFPENSSSAPVDVQGPRVQGLVKFGLELEFMTLRLPTRHDRFTAASVKVTQLINRISP